MLEKAFLLVVAMVGGYASITGTLPAALIALFGDTSVLTLQPTLTSKETGAKETTKQQAQLTSFSRTLGTSIGQGIASVQQPTTVSQA